MSITISRIDSAIVRVLIPTDTDGYRIEVLPHLEYLADTPEMPLAAVSEINIHCPANHETPKLNMIETEANALLRGLATALNAGGIMTEETREALWAFAVAPKPVSIQGTE